MEGHLHQCVRFGEEGFRKNDSSGELCLPFVASQRLCGRQELCVEGGLLLLQTPEIPPPR